MAFVRDAAVGPSARLPLQSIATRANSSDILAVEASYHAIYDHCTSKYLAQAGVANTFVQLADVGIRGNGHMLMLEKNNLEIARFIE